MSNFDLQELQFVDCSQDTPNNYLIQTHKLQSSKKLTQSKDTQISNEHCVSHKSKPSRLMLSSWSQKCRSTASGSSVLSTNQLNVEINNDFNRKNKSIYNNFKKLGQNDFFPCQSCLNNNQQICQICKGQRQLTGENKMVRFFQYILEFKMGAKQSYLPEKKVINAPAPNSHCNVFYSTTLEPRGSQIQSDSRLSLSFNPNRVVSLAEHQQKIKNIVPLHHGYSCDQCDAAPIQGTRFHCEECEDFDLCETCHNRKGHFHNMKKIELKSNQKTLEAVNNMLKLQNPNCLKSSIRYSSSGFGKSMNVNVYKSSIR